MNFWGQLNRSLWTYWNNMRLVLSPSSNVSNNIYTPNVLTSYIWSWVKSPISSTWLWNEIIISMFEWQKKSHFPIQYHHTKTSYGFSMQVSYSTKILKEKRIHFLIEIYRAVFIVLKFTHVYIYRKWDMRRE